MSVDLSIIIVNWNTFDYASACIKSILHTVGALACEVVVVDNASCGDDCERLTASFPGVKVIRSSKNLGFAGANNLGVERATGRYLLFLNPDTVVLENAVAAMLATLQENPDTAIVGCKLLNSDRTVQTSCILPFPTIFNQVADVDALSGRWARRQMGRTEASFSGRRIVDVEAVSGACLMIDRDVFRRMGGFDEGFFMYAEDVALCHGAHQLGRRVVFTDDATVIHHGGGSTRERKGNQWVAMMQRQAVLRFLQLTRGAVYARAYRVSMGLCAVCRLLLIGLLFPFASAATRQSLTRFSSVKWVGVLRWSLGSLQPVHPSEESA